MKKYFIEIKKSLIVTFFAVMVLSILGFVAVMPVNAADSTISLTTNDSASVMITKNGDTPLYGIKFRTEISSQGYAELVSKGAEFGTLVCPTDYLSDGTELVTDGTLIEYTGETVPDFSNKYFYRIKSSPVKSGDVYVFHGSIVNILENNLSRPFSARGYYKIDNEYFYSDIIPSRSIYTVAANALCDPNSGLDNDAKDFLSNVLNTVQSVYNKADIKIESSDFNISGDVEITAGAYFTVSSVVSKEDNSKSLPSAAKVFAVDETGTEIEGMIEQIDINTYKIAKLGSFSIKCVIGERENNIEKIFTGFKCVTLPIDLQDKSQVSAGIIEPGNVITDQGPAFCEPEEIGGYPDSSRFMYQYASFLPLISDNFNGDNYLVFEIFGNGEYPMLHAEFGVDPSTGKEYISDRLYGKTPSGEMECDSFSAKLFNVDGSDYGKDLVNGVNSWITVQIKPKYDFTELAYKRALIFLGSSENIEKVYVRNMRIQSEPVKPLTITDLRIEGVDEEKENSHNEKINLKTTAVIDGERKIVYATYTASGTAQIFNNGSSDAYVLPGIERNTITATYGGESVSISIDGYDKLNILQDEESLKNITVSVDAKFEYQTEPIGKFRKLSNAFKWSVSEGYYSPGNLHSPWYRGFYYNTDIVNQLPVNGYYLYFNMYVPSDTDGGLFLYELITMTDMWTAFSKIGEKLSFNIYSSSGTALTGGGFWNVKDYKDSWVTVECFVSEAAIATSLENSTTQGSPYFAAYDLIHGKELYVANIYATAEKQINIPQIVYSNDSFDILVKEQDYTDGNMVNLSDGRSDTIKSNFIYQTEAIGNRPLGVWEYSDNLVNGGGAAGIGIAFSNQVAANTRAGDYIYIDVYVTGPSKVACGIKTINQTQEPQTLLYDKSLYSCDGYDLVCYKDGVQLNSETGIGETQETTNCWITIEIKLKGEIFKPESNNFNYIGYQLGVSENGNYHTYFSNIVLTDYSLFS